MANFAGIAAARSAKAPGNVVREGMARPARMRLYASEEAHFSIRKAAAMLGIGADNVRERADRRAPAHGRGGPGAPGARGPRRRPPALLRGGQRRHRRDRSRWTRSARSPIWRSAHDLWLHVDGAYGGFAALAPSARGFFARIGEADSVALDPHKWLYLPVGCGCVLYRDPAAARAAFSENAEYTRVVGLEDDEAFAFWDYGPELSRPFRALDLWLLLKSAGTQALGRGDRGEYRVRQIFRGIGGRQRRFRNAGAGGPFDLLLPLPAARLCGDLDAFNERIMVALQRGGSSYLSNARGPRGVRAARLRAELPHDAARMEILLTTCGSS